MTQSVGRQRVEARDDEGILSRYPYLDRLQGRMEEIIDRDLPRTGRRCGNCYGAMRAEDEVCAFCGTQASEREPVVQIPPGILRIYYDKRRSERTWVFGMAFVGLLIASALFVALAVWGPWFLGHPAFFFAVLLFGGYGLAKYFGEVVGGTIGYRRAIRRRDEAWEAHLRERDAGGER
jgi:hypothetical protein